MSIIQSRAKQVTYYLLSPNLRFYKEDNETYFIETEDRIFKVQSEHSEFIFGDIVNDLKFGVILRDLLEKHSDKKEIIEEMFNQFLEQNWLIPIKNHYTIILTNGQLSKLATKELIESSKDDSLIVIDYTDEINEEMLKTSSLVVVASNVPQDVRMFRINELCIRNHIPVLFTGMERGQNAYIGPFWKPKSGTPCYSCLQKRLTLNSLYGRTRQSFQDKVCIESNKVAMEIIPEVDLLQKYSAQLTAVIKKIKGNEGDDFEGKLCWLNKEGTSYEVNYKTLLPIPQCLACEKHQINHNTKKREYEMMDAVDSKVGIVHKVSTVSLNSGEPDIYMATSTATHFTYSQFNAISNSGAGETSEKALLSSLGESLERYAASLINKDELVFKRWNQLGDDALHPTNFALFSEEQYRQNDFMFVPFTENSKVRWIKGENLFSMESKWIPAFSVYLPYRRVKEEDRIMPSISTGLAAGSSLESATLAAIYEVIERDAFTISWLNKLPPRLNTLEGIVENSKYSREHLIYRIYDITLDINIPVIFTVIENHRSEKTISVGGSSRLLKKEAINKAVIEAVQGISYMKDLKRLYQNLSYDNSFSNIDSFQKHASFFNLFPNKLEEVNYLLTPYEGKYRDPLNTTELIPENIKHELNEVLDILKSCNFTPYRVDITPFDLKKLGVYVVRVIIPGLVHLHGNHRYRFLGANRLYDVPKKLGYENIEAINPFPHPYP